MNRGRKYIDGRGWKYHVMPGISGSPFKARFQKPDKNGQTGWKCVRTLPWRDVFTKAQEDLDQLARERGWKEWNPDMEDEKRC